MDEVEKLARALLFDNYFGNYDDYGDVWDDMSDAVRNDCRKRAVAMIKYMESLDQVDKK